MAPSSALDRLPDVIRLYELLDVLETRLGGTRTLAESHGSMAWPRRGLYFFFEPGEPRTTSGTGPRITRIGTHALKGGSRTTLWNRLAQHRGTVGGANPGGGNHRGSVFRLHVGTALIRRDGWPEAITATWATRPSAPRSTRDRERPIEQAVSRHIRAMPFLWLAVEDEPGPGSLRGYLERNAIALLSNFAQADPIDPPSPAWLGRWAVSPAIQGSGLWNVNHVNEVYDPAFLDVLKRTISAWLPE